MNATNAIYNGYCISILDDVDANFEDVCSYLNVDNGLIG